MLRPAIEGMVDATDLMIGDYTRSERITIMNVALDYHYEKQSEQYDKAKRKARKAKRR